MNLQARITAMSDMIDRYDMQKREWSVQSLKDRTFLNVGIEADANIIDAMLLRASVPAIILYEKELSTYECIGGHSVLGTALHVMNNLDTYEPYNLVRRIKETNLDVVIFRCNMSRDDVTFLAKKFYNIDVLEA